MKIGFNLLISFEKLDARLYRTLGLNVNRASCDHPNELSKRPHPASDNDRDESSW